MQKPVANFILHIYSELQIIDYLNLNLKQKNKKRFYLNRLNLKKIKIIKNTKIKDLFLKENENKKKKKKFLVLL